MITVFKREFKASMHSFVGFLFMAVLLFVTGVLVAYYNFVGGSTDIVPALSVAERYVLTLMIPVLCMRSVAEDRKNGTDLLYLSLPLRPTGIVLGKYLALLAVFAIPTGVLCLYPLIFSLYGAVSFAGAYVSLLCFFLVGAGLIALCMFFSSLTSNALVAAMVGVGALAMLYLLPFLATYLPDAAWVSLIGFSVLALHVSLAAYFCTRSPVFTGITAAVLLLSLLAFYIFAASYLEGLFSLFIIFMSPYAWFEYMAECGLFDLRAVVLYLSFAGFFVFLTVQKVGKRRYL